MYCVATRARCYVVCASAFCIQISLNRASALFSKISYRAHSLSLLSPVSYMVSEV